MSKLKSKGKKFPEYPFSLGQTGEFSKANRKSGPSTFKKGKGK